MSIAIIFQTLFFVFVSQTAGAILNIIWLKEPVADLVLEALIAGVASSIIYFYSIKTYHSKQEQR